MGQDSAAKVVELAEPALAQGEALHVLKHDDLFAVFDAWGDVHGLLHPVGPSTGADGLFQDDTRILSRFTLGLAGKAPQLLGGTIGRDNVVFSANLTNPAFQDRTGRGVAPSQIAIHRRRLLWRRKLYEALQVQNFSGDPLSFDLTIDVDADFRDVFEIRGATRARRGEVLSPSIEGNALTLSYRGLDGQVRRTTVAVSVPAVIKGQRIVIPIELQPGASRHLLLAVSSGGDTTRPTRTEFFSALKGSKREARKRIRALTSVAASNASFEAWLGRAAADLSLLITELDTGPYPYAGIPWFSVPFGRDAVVTALQVLWVDPSLARGVLSYLSALQAEERSTFHDAEPGKIMHETRKGEMAVLREVPFSRYYGGVDTTPLFVMLAGAYLKRTNDVAFLQRVWPAVRAALDWVDTFGDADGDGFIEYNRGEEGGLQNQGWKDSHDSVFHADGTLARGPIALVEVQAYVVAAKRAAAQIAAAIGQTEEAERRAGEADRLQASIDARFWCDPIGTYALALDGAKRPCAVRTSNAGHVLFCGVASPDKAARVARDLMSQDLFSGWGVRTVAVGQSRYNPMSYHNGTVWPHDCSIVAAGLARYGMGEAAGRIFTGLFDAACRSSEFRLPELFCGFARRAGEGPVSYPSACTPQAWASGAVFLMLQACLGIDIDAKAGLIEVAKPYLPAFLDHVVVRDLAVGEGRATLHFRRGESGVEVGISAAEGDVRLVHMPDSSPRRSRPRA
jgi:glycogen debranching enzyme